jgi:hypothetical protein
LQTSNCTYGDSIFSTAMPLPYGTFTEDNKVMVEAIYEPPQEADPDAPEGFVLHDDPKEDTVEQLAQLLGLRKVGGLLAILLARRFVLSASEISHGCRASTGGCRGD